MKDIPKEYELYRLLIDINDKWYDIGLSLQVHQNVLMDLKRSNYSSFGKLRKVVYNFLTTKPSPVSWETVISAIEGPIINNQAKANEIRQYLSTGKSNKLLLLSNEVINSGVQTTIYCKVYSIQFKSTLFTHNVHQLNVIEKSN